MAENDAEKKVDVADEEDETIDPATDATDWKERATLLEQKLKDKGIAHRERTKILKEQLKKFEAANPSKKEAEQIKGFDYGQKAFLKASGISSEEYPLVEEVIAATGKDLESVLESKYFPSELKDFRDAKTTKSAVPSGQKRSTSSTQDTVEYWIAKGQLPPADQRELRSKVVRAKRQMDSSKSPFA